jgi:hypothetical protein
MPGCSFGQLGMPLIMGPPGGPGSVQHGVAELYSGSDHPLVSEALRTEPIVDVIKLERDCPVRFAHLWRTADVGSVFSLQWRAGSIGRTWRSRIP